MLIDCVACFEWHVTPCSKLSYQYSIIKRNN